MGEQSAGARSLEDTSQKELLPSLRKEMTSVHDLIEQNPPSLFMLLRWSPVSMAPPPNDTVQCLDYVEMTLVFLELVTVPRNYLNFRLWHPVVYISVCTLGPLTQ